MLVKEEEYTGMDSMFSVFFEDYVILLATTVTGGSELRCFNGFVKNGEEVPCCESETEKAIAQCRCRGPVWPSCEK